MKRIRIDGERRYRRTYRVQAWGNNRASRAVVLPPDVGVGPGDLLAFSRLPDGTWRLWRAQKKVLDKTVEV